ncbi:MAG: DUF2237 family protein [Planctomycetota bacterium]|jgi:uncharacterized protein (DUF2237 family)
MAKNVLGETLQPCSMDPLTGWFRTGCCETDESDMGAHVVCIRATPAFLAYSKARGNDLSTPNPAYGFPGIKPGDRWCLCAERWSEALARGVAPPVVLAATHERALEYCSLDDLRAHALDESKAEER